MNEEIKLEYMHLCDYAVPGVSGKVNLIGIFDSFNKPAQPRVFDFFIALRIGVKTKGKYQVTFEIQSSKDNSKVEFDNKPMDIPEMNYLHFNILRPFKNINFKETGRYKFIVLVNNLPIGYKEVEVNPVPVKQN